MNKFRTLREEWCKLPELFVPRVSLLLEDKGRRQFWGYTLHITNLRLSSL